MTNDQIISGLRAIAQENRTHAEFYEAAAAIQEQGYQADPLTAELAAVKADRDEARAQLEDARTAIQAREAILTDLQKQIDVLNPKDIAPEIENTAIAADGHTEPLG